MALVDDLRRLVAASPTEYVAGGVTYWTDPQLTDALNRHKTHHHRVRVDWRVSYDGSGGVQYKRGRLWLYGTLQTSYNGTLETDTGAAVTGFTLTSDGWITLTTPVTTLPAYYWTGDTYDVEMAAVEVLEAWASHEKIAFGFATDGQQFNRDQKHRMLLAQADRIRARKQPALA